MCVVLLWWVTYPKWKMASLWRVTYPSGKKKEWSHSYGWPTQGGEWPHYNGWPTQVKKKMENGLILMGDLPIKMVSLWWVTYLSGKNVKNGLIMMGDLPKWKECEVQSQYNGWPTQMEDGKNMKWSHCYGWPTQVEDEKNVKWSHYNGWPTQVEDRKMLSGLIVMGDLPRWRIEKMWSAVSL